MRQLCALIGDLLGKFGVQRIASKISVGLFAGALLAAICMVSTGSAYAQGGPPDCILGGNNVNCRTCAGMNNGGAGRVVPNNLSHPGTNNNSCRVQNLANGETIRVEITNGVKIANDPVNLDFSINISPFTANPTPFTDIDPETSPTTWSYIQRFTNDGVTKDTTVGISIADSIPSQPNTMSATTTCFCQPATGTIEIEKVVVGTDKSFSFSASHSGGALQNLPPNFSLSTGQSQGPHTENTGTITVIETPDPNYDTTISCTGDTTANTIITNATGTAQIGLDSNENIKCTFTNTERQAAKGTVTIKKVESTGDNNPSFSFTASHSGALTNLPANFNLINGGMEGPHQEDTGTITVVETTATHTTAISCTGDTTANTVIDNANRTVQIGLDANENIECTFTNTPPPQQGGTITIVKDVVGTDKAFTFNVTNGAPVNLPTNFMLSDTQSTGPHAEAAGTFEITETLDANYTTTISCIENGGIGDSGETAAGVLEIILQDGETVECTYTNRQNPQRTGTIQIRKNTIGGEGAFSYSSSEAALNGLALNTVGGTALSGAIAVPVGVVTVTENDPTPSGFTLTGLSCADPDGGTSTNLGTRTATVDVDDGEAIVCTYTNTNVPDKTSEVIKRFLNRRNDLLLSEDPDRNRWVRRFLGSTWGGGPSSGFAGGAVSMTMQGIGGNQSKTTFATSFSQIAKSFAVAQDKKAREAAKMAGKDGEEPALGVTSVPNKDLNTGLDFWVEGHYTTFDDTVANSDSNGNLGILYLGTDYLISPSILLGALLQFDWMDQEAPDVSTTVNGKGWMAGPYVTVKLDQNLYFDARAAWGESENDISPFNTYTDRFDTQRWLVRGNLTGNWEFDGMRVTPSASVAYIEEDQESYFDSLGNFIPGQEVSLGRVTFGPEFAYRFLAEDGTIVEPHIKLEGLWDFDKDDNITLNGFTGGTGDFRGKVTGGVILKTDSGFAVRATGSYDGIGEDDLEAYGGQIWVNIPLN